VRFYKRPFDTANSGCARNAIGHDYVSVANDSGEASQITGDLNLDCLTSARQPGTIPYRSSGMGRPRTSSSPKGSTACNHWTGVGLIAVEPVFDAEGKRKERQRGKGTSKLTMFSTTFLRPAPPAALEKGSYERLAEPLCECSTIQIRILTLREPLRLLRQH
jgi:hypothetical protein